MWSVHRFEGDMINAGKRINRLTVNYNVVRWLFLTLHLGQFQIHEDTRDNRLTEAQSRAYTHTFARKLPNEMNIDRFVSKRKRKTLPEILAFVCCFNLLALIFHEKRRRKRERKKNAVSFVYIKGLTSRKPSLQMHMYVHVFSRRALHFNQKGGTSFAILPAFGPFLSTAWLPSNRLLCTNSINFTVFNLWIPRNKWLNMYPTSDIFMRRFINIVGLNSHIPLICSI